MTVPQRALVLVDVQQDYFEDSPLVIQYPNREDSLAKITEAIDAAAAADVPVIMVQHTSGSGAPVFNPDSSGFDVRPEIKERRQDSWKSVVKQFGSVYADTDVAQWLREQNVDTVTLVGFMTNNCILASAVEGEGLGFTTEVLRDATGAINISNDAGFADAETVHSTLMTVLNSNFAAVATTQDWTAALGAGEALPKSDLGSSAVAGAQEAARNVA
ncbi:isochorismatase family protein [Brevibacterium spongiae]|uniref:Isochorismatase family protein n=1 Tax=Brevibacterium spongiae TaxID=2909672 RepID=A0ABY5SQ89_9MICO|nr:isochorismatase family protein [Brevibacterium spongiae]UVI35226.1 isochorismatase family protein [Brevibacterium spongiae]